MITFNPSNKKRMTIRECFEPLQFIRDFNEAERFFVDLLGFITAGKVDYITGMLSTTQQAKLYMNEFVELNKDEGIKKLIKECFQI